MWNSMNVPEMWDEIRVNEAWWWGGGGGGREFWASDFIMDKD